MKTDGWQKVFKFTFIQQIKTKSFIAGSIAAALIVILLVSGLNIIPKLAGFSVEEVLPGEGGSSEIEGITAVYIMDDSGILTDEDYALVQSSGITVKDAGAGRDETISRLSGSGAGEILVSVYAVEYNGYVQGYQVKTHYSHGTNSNAVDIVTNLVSGLVTRRNILNLGVSPEAYPDSQRPVSTSKIEAGAEEWNVFESMINGVVPLVVSLLLFILIFTYGQSVAQSIAIEKTSRVMELLLTSVRPLAVVIGKVLAMGLISILQFLLIGILGAASFFATAPFGVGGDIMKMMSTPELQVGENAQIAEAVSNSLGKISPLTFVLIIIIFILGFLFFALIAALVGASVSRMEDLAQAMQPYSLLGVFGFYLAYFPSFFNTGSFETGAASTNPMQIFSYYFPVSSPFALPSALMLGSLSLGETMIAVLILAAFDVLVAIFVSKVYELIILHNGNRLKIKDIVALVKSK